MYKVVNGEKMAMTTEEIAEQETKRKTFEAAERSRPLTAEEALDIIVGGGSDA